MANTTFRLKRSTVSGVTPTTGDISIGELAVNLRDRKLFTSNGSAVYELGSNLTNLAVSGNLTIGSSGDLVFTNGAGVFANGVLGTAGQLLTSNGTGVYWSTIPGVNTSAQYAWANVQTFNANIVVNSGLVANSSAGSAGQVLHSNGTSVYWSQANSGLSEVVTQQFTANGTANSFLVSGGYFPNAIEVYLAGVKQVPGVDVTLTSGSTVNFAVPPLTGQIVDVFGYKAANNLQSISAIVSQQFTANGTANTFTITPGYIPNAIEVYVSGVKRIPVTDVDITTGSTITFTTAPLNGQVVDVFGYRSVGAISPYLEIAGGTMTGNLTFNNTAVIIANGSFGTNGQVLTSNGTSMYWSSAGFTNGQSISVNNFVIAGAFTANGANGAAGQVLTTNGTGVYWSSAGVNTAEQYSWTNTHTFNANVTFGNRVALINNTNSTFIQESANATHNVISFTAVTPGAGRAEIVCQNSAGAYVYSTTRSSIDTMTSFADYYTSNTANHRGGITIYTEPSRATIDIYQNQLGAGGGFGIFQQANSSTAVINVYFSNTNNTAARSSTAIRNGSITVSNATTISTVNTTGIYLGNTTTNVVITTATSTFGANVVISASANVAGNLTITSTGELIVANGAGIEANGSFGSAGQVLTSNGTGVYWATAAAGVNTAAQFSWSNTHSFSSNVTISNTLILSNTAVTDITNTNFGALTITGSPTRLPVYGDINIVNFTDLGSMGMRYARGTIGSPTSVQDGDRLGSFFHGGYHLGLSSGAGGWINPVQIASFVDGNTSTVSTNIPARLSFFTAPLNGSRTERMRITANGNVGIGTTSPVVRLAVSSTDAIQIPAGTTAERPSASNGMIRYNTNTQTIEAVANNTWTNMLAAYSSVREQFTASNNQTTFTVTGGYIAGQIDVYYNGIKLRSGSEVNISSGTTVVLATGAANNALVEVVGIGPTFVVSNTAQIVYQQFTATNNQTTFTVSNGYVPGQVDVFADGIHLVNGVDVNVSSGGSIVLSAGVPNNTIVEVKGYSTPITSAQSSTAVRQTFTANSTVNNNFTVTGGYIPGQVDVFYNGAKLVNGSDVNTSSGTTIVLTSNAVSNAIVDIVGINYFTAGGGVTTPVRQQLVATANQTTFTVTGGYTPGQIDVFRNGVKLTPGADVNISGGSTVVLVSPAANGDNIDVVGFAATSYQDSVRKSGDTISGSLAISANLAVTGGVTFSNTIAVAGTSTLTGNVTTAGVFTDAVATIRPLVADTVRSATLAAVDFTGIPSWVRRITIVFNGVSTTGTSILMVQIGSGSIVATGYTSVGSGVAATVASTTSTAGFIIGNTNHAPSLSSGSFVLTNISGNIWVGNGMVCLSAIPQTNFGTGNSPTLSGTLDRIRVTTVNGTDTFDAGTINILYE